MADKTTNDLQKVERAMNKLKRKVKRADLDYNVQFSINSVNPTEVVYAAQMTPLAEGLRPATFISHVSAEDLIAQVKAFTESLDWEKLEIAYHNGQIVSAEKTIQGHKEAIEELENPTQTETEEESSTEEDPKAN